MFWSVIRAVQHAIRQDKNLRQYGLGKVVGIGDQEGDWSDDAPVLCPAVDVY